MLLNLAHPRLHCSETLSVGNIVGDNDSMSSLVVAGSDSFESLLAGGVPDLKLDSLSVHIDGPDFLKTRLVRTGETYEVDANVGN